MSHTNEEEPQDQAAWTERDTVFLMKLICFTSGPLVLACLYILFVLPR